MPKSTETMELIAFQVPKPLKRLIQKYAKHNGYSISYVVRKSVETQILSPDLKTQTQLWKELLKWMQEINAWRIETSEFLRKIFELVKKHDQKTE